MKHTIIYHSIVLIACSIIGFIGHYLQFGIIRVTPWVPASIGLLLIVTTRFQKNRIVRYFSFFIVVGFGILVINMFFRFLHQDFQPIRKKIVFFVMSFSSIISLIVLIIRKMKCQCINYGGFGA